MWLDFKNHTVVPQELILLQLIKQNQKEDLREEVEFYVTDRVLDIFLETGYVELIKARNKADTRQNRARLTSKGKELLEELETPPVLEEDEKIAEWLTNHYKKLEKEIGNGKKLRRHIRDFRIASDIQKNNLIILCLDFLKENEENSRVLEYIWYYPKTVFATKFQLEDSWLYKHYIKKEEYFKSVFENYDK